VAEGKIEVVAVVGIGESGVGSPGGNDVRHPATVTHKISKTICFNFIIATISFDYV
jgi:hypothetical protein